MHLGNGVVCQFYLQLQKGQVDLDFFNSDKTLGGGLKNGPSRGRHFSSRFCNLHPVRVHSLRQESFKWTIH